MGFADNHEHRLSGHVTFRTYPSDSFLGLSLPESAWRLLTASLRRQVFVLEQQHLKDRLPKLVPPFANEDVLNSLEQIAFCVNQMLRNYEAGRLHVSRRRRHTR